MTRHIITVAMQICLCFSVFLLICQNGMSVYLCEHAINKPTRERVTFT